MHFTLIGVRILIVASGLLMTIGSARAQTVLYVDAHAAGPTHDGSSRCEACDKLNDALAVAYSGDTIKLAGAAAGLCMGTLRLFSTLFVR